MIARFGTSAPEAETLIRVGALLCHSLATGYAKERAVMATLGSFSDPENVIDLGAEIWARIESE